MGVAYSKVKGFVVAALVGGISKCWCHLRARNRGNIFLASIIEFFSIFALANDKSCIYMGGRGGHMVTTSFCALVVTISPAQTLQVTYLQLFCNWMFELLAMACNRSFNMLNILHRSLDISANFHPIFKLFSPLFLVV